MTPTEIALMIAGYVLAVNRLLNVVKPLANVGPVWFQVGFPAVLSALPQLYNELTAQQIDQVGIVQAVLTALVAVVIAIRGPKPPAGKGTGPQHGEEGSTVHKGPPTLSLRGLAVAFGCLILVSCASAKPVVRTVNDLAFEACQIYFGQKNSISLEDAAKTFCDTQEKLKPWLDEILAAQQRAGAKASP